VGVLERNPGVGVVREFDSGATDPLTGAIARVRKAEVVGALGRVQNGPGRGSLGDACFVIQFCDRNADELRTFLDDDGSPAGDDRSAAGSLEHRGVRRELMDPIRLLEPPEGGATGSPTGASRPPQRVWNAIEATLRREGLVSS